MGLMKTCRVHLVGIGGSGMSGIAEVLISLGHKVRGSDITRSETVFRLEKLGAKIFIGHDGDNIGDADVLVVSSAVQADNPEVLAARSRKIPVIPRAEMLADLMRMKEGIAVAGAHGKTTTSTLIATILADAGMDPTVIIGGRVKKFGTGGRLGKGEFLVAEADESDGSFLELDAKIAVVTGIDREHLDHYGNMANLEAAFLHFCNKVPFFGATIACGDDPVLRGFAPKMNKRFITYGFSDDCDLVGKDYAQKGLVCTFSVHRQGERLGDIALHLPGIHNARNCLAAIQVGLYLGVDFDTMAVALGNFSGIGRRLEIKGEKNGVTVIDDYGHHPSEVRATLKGLREAFADRRIVTLFQPHRYTRTRDCLADFLTAFGDTDVLALMPIYPAGEKPVEGVSTRLIYDGVKKTAGGKNIYLLEHDDEVQDWLTTNIERNDVLLTLGAGNVFLQGEKFLENDEG